MDSAPSIAPPGIPGDSLAERRGNRCGHDPRNPALNGLLRTGKDGHPAILSRALERFCDWYKRPTPFPGEKREHPMRSERREAVLRLLEAVFYRMELSSRFLGTPNTKTPPYGFVDSSMADLAKKSGLGKRRCERAMRELMRAGFISSKRRSAMTADGNYYGLRAIRRVEDALINFLDMTNAFSAQAAEARKRLTDKARLAGLKSLNAFFRRTAANLAKNRKKPNASGGADAQTSTEWNNALLAAMTNNPDKPPDALYREVNARLGLPEDYHP